ncbi:LAQU0S05e05600g1_1 [Lachancea quebecensis]|uniref:LAQU0S05e05600g1_1 n=1 Tax=Lachancea quebecensis TaxID=1654605 RepID=A0A0P1KTQ7_9SACH|nr:LAQU0S05e05600g1_1 [Lachancea quebecensis]
MLGLGSGHIYSMANQSTVSNMSKDEKYDYEDEVSDENEDSGISLTKVRAEQGFSLRSFIDQINAKTKALAIARELDAQRGVTHQDATMSAGSIDSTTSASTETQRTQELSSHPTATVRRIPSGARASTAEPNLGSSTPMKEVPRSDNSHNQTINDLLVQSTPINSSKSVPTSRNAQPRDLLKEKLMESHKTQNGRSASGNVDELQFENVRLREELNFYKKAHDDQEQSIQVLQETLQKQSQTAQTLRAKLQELQGQVEESAKALKVAQDDRRSEFEGHQQVAEELIKCKGQIRMKEDEIFNVTENANKVCQDLKSNNANLQNRAIEIQSALTESELCVQQLRSKVDLMKKHNDDLSQTVHDKIEELNECAVQMDKIRRESVTQENTLRGRLREYDTELSSLKDRNEELQKRLESQESEFNSKSSSYEALISSLKKANEDLENVFELERTKSNKKEHALESDVATLRQRLSDVGKENENTLVRFNMLEKQHSEAENLRDGLEETNQELKSVVTRLEKISSDQLQTIGKLEEEVERKSKKEANSLLSARKHSKQLEEKVRQLQDVIVAKNSELEMQKSEHDQFENYLKSVSLFQKQAGDLIVEQYQLNKYVTQMDAAFQERNPDVLGFFTQDQLRTTESSAIRLEALDNELHKLEDSIKNEWTVKVQHLEEKLVNQELKEGTIAKQLEESNLKVEELNSTVDALAAEKRGLLHEKEKSMEVQQRLNDQVNSLKAELVDGEHRAFVTLSSRIESLGEERLDLQQNLRTLDSKLRSTETLLEEANTLLSQERSDYAASQDEAAQLRKDLAKLKGKASRKITFQMASQSRPHLSRKAYDSLMVDAVNDMDMVELQNIIKNIILLLEIPLSKITKKMPLVGIYLRYEKNICLHFANKIHYMMFRETIDIKRYTNIAYGQYLDHHDICHLDHPLESCLDNLYKEVGARLSSSPLTNG